MLILFRLQLVFWGLQLFFSSSAIVFLSALVFFIDLAVCKASNSFLYDDPVKMVDFNDVLAEAVF